MIQLVRWGKHRERLQTDGRTDRQAGRQTEATGKQEHRQKLMNEFRNRMRRGR